MSRRAEGIDRGRRGTRIGVEDCVEARRGSGKRLLDAKGAGRGVAMSNEDVLETLRYVGLNVSGVYLKSYYPPHPDTSQVVEWETPEGFEITVWRSKPPLWRISYLSYTVIGSCLFEISKDLVLDIRNGVSTLQEALL